MRATFPILSYARREVEAVHCRAQQCAAGVVNCRVTAREFGSHLRIAVYSLFVPEALFLYLGGSNHTLADGCARLALARVGNFLKGNGDNLYLKVDAVEDFIDLWFCIVGNICYLYLFTLNRLKKESIFSLINSFFLTITSIFSLGSVHFDAILNNSNFNFSIASLK